jgi:hypothetical protein
MSDKLRIGKLAQWAYTIKDLVQWVRGLRVMVFHATFNNISVIS